VWWRRRDAALDDEAVDGIIRKLMDIDVKLERLLEHLGLCDDEEDDDT
jgi:hypothetical protein